MSKGDREIRSRLLKAGVLKEEPQITAKEILSPNHPVHRHFTQWVEQRNAEVQSGTDLTVRKARKFLAAFPRYRGAA